MIADDDDVTDERFVGVGGSFIVIVDDDDDDADVERRKGFCHNEKSLIRFHVRNWQTNNIPDHCQELNLMDYLHQQITNMDRRLNSYRLG